MWPCQFNTNSFFQCKQEILFTFIFGIIPPRHLALSKTALSSDKNAAAKQFYVEICSHSFCQRQNVFKKKRVYLGAFFFIKQFVLCPPHSLTVGSCLLKRLSPIIGILSGEINLSCTQRDTQMTYRAND